MLSLALIPLLCVHYTRLTNFQFGTTIGGRINSEGWTCFSCENIPTSFLKPLILLEYRLFGNPMHTPSQNAHPNLKVKRFSEAYAIHSAFWSKNAKFLLIILSFWKAEKTSKPLIYNAFRTQQKPPTDKVPFINRWYTSWQSNWELIKCTPIRAEVCMRGQSVKRYKRFMRDLRFPHRLNRSIFVRKRRLQAYDFDTRLTTGNSQLSEKSHNPLKEPESFQIALII